MIQSTLSNDPAQWDEVWIGPFSLRSQEAGLVLPPLEAKMQGNACGVCVYVDALSLLPLYYEGYQPNVYIMTENKAKHEVNFLISLRCYLLT